MDIQDAYVIKNFDNTQNFKRPICLKLAGLYQNACDHNLTSRTIDEYVLIYCIDGKGFAVLNGIKNIVEKGDIVFLPKNQPHSYGNVEGESWSIIWFHFTGIYGEYFINQFNPVKTNSIIKLLPNHAIYDDFYKAVTLIAQIKSFNDVIAAEAAFTLALCRASAGSKSDFQSDSVQKAYVDKAVFILEEEKNGFVSLDELSDKVGISKFYLIRLFKKFLDMTPKEYECSLNLKRGCRLLMETELSICEISIRLGFCNQYHFSKSFKQYFGYSPSKFRKLI